jgi:hypothetical protein
MLNPKTVNRQSLLIGASREITIWESFLRSSLGGAWQAEEIAALSNPARDQVLAAVASSRGADYCFVVCIGGGETKERDLPWPETTMTFSGGVTVTERELNNGSPRCVLLLDCSAGTSATESRIDAPQAWPHESTPEHRMLYDQALEHAEAGLVKLIVTGRGPECAETVSASEAILQQVSRWSAQHHGIFELGNAVQCAALAMKGHNAPLQLQYLPGRRRHDFPIGVCIAQ